MAKRICAQCVSCNTPDFFLSLFVIYIQEGSWFMWVNLVSCYFAEVICRSYLVEFLWSPKTILLSANKDILTSCFSRCISFIFISCVIAVAKTSNTVLDSDGESGQPCLVPDVSGKALCFSSFKLMLAICLLYIVLILLSYVCSFYSWPSLH